jgi:hypothetical protein
LSKIGERQFGVIEEHDPELADDAVETAACDAMGLGVGDDELDVLDRGGSNPASRDLDERFGEIQADRLTDTTGGGLSRGAAPASDVEEDVVRLEVGTVQEGRRERLELTVVPVGVFDVVDGLAAIPRLELLLVR